MPAYNLPQDDALTSCKDLLRVQKDSVVVMVHNQKTKDYLSLIFKNYLDIKFFIPKCSNVF